MSGYRFEIVRTKAGHHARFVAPNGKLVWVTESYLRRRPAVQAIERICAAKTYTSHFGDHPEIDWAGQEHPTEVRDVDERG